jgi:hypothetical protein
MPTDQSENEGKLIEAAAAHLDFHKIINDHSRSGEYTLLFLKTGESDGNEISPSLWVNAWLASDEHVAEIEASSDHLQGRYINEGFHPGYGTGAGGPFYEPMYGGPLEPLALGWSADDKHIAPDISQEFERCYKLTRVDSDRKTVWNSWQEAIDEVAALERGNSGRLVLTARTDFIRDFQYLKRRWLLMGVYGEWGDRGACLTGQHSWAIEHVAGKHKLHIFGALGEAGYEYVEIQGYFLTPMPNRPQFSAAFGFEIPAGLKASVETIEFYTSDGKMKPFDLRTGTRRGAQFSACAVFDQEVLRQYQCEAGAEVSVDNTGQLQVRSRKVHLSHLAMLLGTEYVSVWMGYFIEGVPPSEWAHWQRFNVPFIGFEKQKELFEEKNLFRMTAEIIRQARLVNYRWAVWNSGATDANGTPFKAEHKTDKDFRTLSRALLRHTDSLDLIDRAKSLDGLIIERIAATAIRVFLRRIGFAAGELEKLGSIKLFSSFMMVVRIADAASAWHESTAHSLAYAQQRVAAWQKNVGTELSLEESSVIDRTVREFEILFLIHDLRVISAHATTDEMDLEIHRAFETRLGVELEPSQYRDAIIRLYGAALGLLEGCRE